MHFHSSHPLQPYWDLAAAPIQAQALESAIEHALFSMLSTPARARTVAMKLHLNDEATQVWLDLLWSMGLLVRHTPDDNPQDPDYAPSPLASQFFLPDAVQDCAAAWLYRMRLLKNFANQGSTLLREGFDPQTARRDLAPKGSWAQAAREQIGQEQRAITAPAVMKLLDSLPPLPEHGNFLDVGGGPGHVAIALARRLPEWHGRVCDQDETVAVAQENIAQAGLTLRMNALACDLNHHVISGKYDLIWCSSVLHFMRDPQQVVKHIASALNPKGILLIAHAERSADNLLAAKTLPFYTPLMLRNNYLPYPGEIKNMLHQARLTDIQDLGLVDFPLAPVKVYSARQC